MKTLKRRSLLKASLLGLTGTASMQFGSGALARTDSFPKLIKILMPLAAGGAVDASARKIAEQLSRLSGSNFIIENKPGASGLIAAQAVSQAADTATLLWATSGLLTVQAMTGRIDFLKDFKPISKISSSAFLLVVSGNSNFRTFTDLVGAAQARPGALNFGSAGNGSPIHLIHEVMAEKVIGGFDTTNIPFKGGSIEAVLALLGGQIHFTYALPGAVAEHIQSGRLRALAVTGAARLSQFPQVPTLVECGVSGFQRDSWSGLVAKAQASEEFVERLSTLTPLALRSPEVVEIFNRDGTISKAGQTPMQFEAELRLELEAERQLVKKLGLKA